MSSKLIDLAAVRQKKADDRAIKAHNDALTISAIREAITVLYPYLKDPEIKQAVFQLQRKLFSLRKELENP